MKTPRETYDEMAESEGVAKATIGTAAVALMRSRDAVSRKAIVALLDDVADGRRQVPTMNAMLAKAALRFISTLPEE